jgi:hypothetical protein
LAKKKEYQIKPERSLGEDDGNAKPKLEDQWSRPNQTGKGMGEEEAMPNQI